MDDQSVYFINGRSLNHLGNEAGRVIYDGDILIAHKGKLIAKNRRFSFHKHNLLSIEIDDSISNHTNILEDYNTKNEEFVHAASLGLFDYLRKSRAGGYALSLSGGADSSITAVLVAEVVRNGVDELGIEQRLSVTND